jgi:hypothetical protein
LIGVGRPGSNGEIKTGTLAGHGGTGTGLNLLIEAKLSKKRATEPPQNSEFRDIMKKMTPQEREISSAAARDKRPP